ncbi:MAG: hypothetical protein PHY48_16060 [Candidatus Cloacimonetes bacterium]|nr:hypothetical protein [Candidatus Cloacimonadota bacterium]
MQTKIVLLSCFVMSFSGCQNTKYFATLIDSQNEILRFSIVDDKRIALSDFIIIAGYRSITAQVLERDYTEVTFNVRATKYSIVRKEGDEKPTPRQVLHESHESVFINTSELIDIFESHIQRVPDNYGRDEPYWPKRLFIYYNTPKGAFDVRSFTVKSTIAIENIWSVIKAYSVANPEFQIESSDEN